MSGFVERVVEGWLTRANERGYQLAFASWLGRQGHVIKYLSPHSTLEHGKDIVTLKARRIHAYQLKAGNIDKKFWRSIRGEVQEAAQVPIDVPGLASRLPDSAYLVLTGTCSDAVRHEISLLNREHARRSEPEIQLIELPELVANFSKTFEDFFPNAVGPLASLVKLHLEDGRGPLSSGDLLGTLQGLMPVKNTPKEIQRSCANVIVASQFVAAPYRAAKNYVSEINTWTMAACSIMLHAKAGGISLKTYAPYLDLCWIAIRTVADELINDAVQRQDFIEGGGLAESFILPVRRVVVLGYIGAAINARTILGDEAQEISAQLLHLVEREKPLAPWGEGSWNYLLNLAVALRHTAAGSRLGEGLVLQWIEQCCRPHPPFAKDPYWTVGEYLGSFSRPQDERPGDQLKVSYSAMSAMGFLARRMLRRNFSPLWSVFSKYRHARLVPNEPWRYLEWSAESGELQLREMPLRGSWKDLRGEGSKQRARLFDAHEARFLPFFLCAYPHRVDPNLSGELDYQTSPPNFLSEWVD